MPWTSRHAHGQMLDVVSPADWQQRIHADSHLDPQQQRSTTRGNFDALIL